MNRQAIGYENSAELRARALARLTGGRGAGDARFNASAALGVLYELASSPATAADALALLHELQVHQVEIELQGEELHRSRAEIESALCRHVQLFEQAPVGYLAADGAGVLREINAEGARLLGVALEDCPGRPLDGFLVPDSGRLLRAMLERIGAGARRDSCRLQVVPITGALRVIDAHASADAVRGGFLVALVPAA